MEFVVNGSKYTQFNNISIDLEFDSIASSFGLDLFYDPSNPDHKALVRPGEFQAVEILHEGEQVLKGNKVSSEFSLSSEPSLASIDGYSKSGILEDCTIAQTSFPLQKNNQSLVDVAETLVAPFGLQVEVDSKAQSEANKTYDKIEAKESNTVKQVLAGLANQRNIVLTHTTEGNVLLTKADTNQRPILQLNEGQPNTTLTLSVNGQNLHSSVTVIGQQQKDSKNSPEATVSNPLVNAERPVVTEQTSGDDQSIEKAAKDQRSGELREIELSGELSTITANGSLIRPGRMVRVKAPSIFINSVVDFYLTSVSLNVDQESKTTSFKAVLPEVFNGDTPQQIFK